MRLTRRLLLAYLIAGGALVAFVLAIASRRFEQHTADVLEQQLGAQARLITFSWRPQDSPDSLADAAGAAVGHRVTLVDHRGQVLGDSDFDPPALSRLESFADRPEIAAAMAGPEGRPFAAPYSAASPSITVAVRGRVGIALLTAHASALRENPRNGGADVIVALVLVGGVVLGLALYLSQTVSQPLVELRSVARAMARGDLERRPTLSAPGEIGDLAVALHRMAEQLASRLDALQADEALMTALFEALSEGVVATDARGRVLRINDTARKLLGARAPTPFPAELLPREPDLREALGAALRGIASEPFEVRIGDRTLALTAQPLSAGGAVLTVFDLTTLRRLEIVRRDFVANVSHELKTPLTVISGFAETLVDDDPPPEQRKHFAETIRANARRMQRIVDDLLDLSRIESGGWRPNPSVVQVRDIAEDALASVAASVSPDVSCSVAIGEGADRVFADPTALRQVLGNLVDNATRYTQRGSITVFSERDVRGTWVGVRDTGAGIAVEHLPRIFERFYRADPSRSRELGGTGLGLAIVRHLAEAHGGRVRAESVLGAGTTIAAFFPDAQSSPGSMSTRT